MKKEINIKCWGVRGSLPMPLTDIDVKNKISAVVSRITSDDVRTKEDKELFISSLPEWLYGTWGGNTSCVEIKFPNNISLLFDAGSGIRNYSIWLSRQKDNRKSFHVFFSHFHWDHIMGLPFFQQLYSKDVEAFFYSPVRKLKEYLYNQMLSPYFPVTMDAMACRKNFVVLNEESPYKIKDIFVTPIPVEHPGGCYAYKVEYKNKKIMYATDVELEDDYFIDNPRNKKFFYELDFLIIDSQYTLGESIEKYKWGHSSFSLVVDFAIKWNIKKVLMFHHEPLYDDKLLFQNLQAAREYARHQGNELLEIELAKEDKTYCVGLD
ncbi:MBL fold metallo-hydrolase [Spirochaetia bacterium 38H-sp]|uniref:MBL fold metallo-hydrolase n=1 Tax=Rarispira pelagica TaxID=3141764 RepID=A0ABU9UAQ1_9SPIR